MNGAEPFAELVVRPVDEGDFSAVVATYRRLSAQSLYRRLFTLTPDPAPLVTEQLAAVDHHDHEALIALDGSRVVAIAQWDRSRRHPEEAEVAITVEDAWQHKGLGTALIRELATDAYDRGVTTLTASVLTENQPALRLARGYAPASVDMDGTESRFTFTRPRRIGSARKGHLDRSAPHRGALPEAVGPSVA